MCYKPNTLNIRFVAFGFILFSSSSARVWPSDPTAKVLYNERVATTFPPLWWDTRNERALPLNISIYLWGSTALWLSLRHISPKNVVL